MTTGGSRADQTALRVLVVTVSHRGDDARIVFRQIGAMADAGCSGRLVAPAPEVALPGRFDRVAIRRATGRRRVRSWFEAWRAVREARGSIDLVLVHDLEAVLPVRLARPGVPVVWDVHEDLPASVVDRAWIPRLAKRPARLATSLVERIVRRGAKLLLAEEAYSQRLGDWPIVPNTTIVPPFEPDRPLVVPPVAIYVGRLSASRGVRTMIEVGRLLDGRAEIVMIGSADGEVAAEIEAANARGDVTWSGPLPNPEALRALEGAVVGLCLLDDLPNYTRSMPTKIYEYSAHGLPTIVTALPLARQAVERSGAGVVVDFDDPGAVVAAIDGYLHDSDRRHSESEQAHDWVRRHHDWRTDGAEFVRVLRRWAAV